MANYSDHDLEGYSMYVCGIELRILKDFKEKVYKICNHANIFLKSYLCQGKSSWYYAVLKVNSEDAIVELMIQLGGKRLGNGFIKLKLFWPLNYPSTECARLYQIAKCRAGYSTDHESGCFYHESVEKKKAIALSMLGDRSVCNPAGIEISNIPHKLHDAELIHFISQAGAVQEMNRNKPETAHVVYMEGRDALIAAYCLDKFKMQNSSTVTVKLDKDNKDYKVMQNILDSWLCKLSKVSSAKNIQDCKDMESRKDTLGDSSTFDNLKKILLLGKSKDNQEITYMEKNVDRNQDIICRLVPISCMVIEYFNLILNKTLQDIARQHQCQIHIKTSVLVQTRYALEIKGPAKNVAIMEKISRTILYAVRVDKTEWKSRFSKMGKFLTLDKYKTEIKHLQEENECLLKTIKNYEDDCDVSPWQIESENNVIRHYQQSVHNWITKVSGTPRKTITRFIVNASYFLKKSDLPNDKLKSNINTMQMINQKELKINNMTIKLIKGDIEQEFTKTDIIVNYVSLEQYDQGEIAKKLRDIGGWKYKLECFIAYRSHKGVDDIISTAGLHFGCYYVYHIPYFSSDGTILSLTAAIERCLDEADKENLQSISIPIVGPLNTNLNRFHFASRMIHQVANFAKISKKNSKLTSVHFVIQSNADYKVFRKVLLSVAQKSDLTNEQTKHIEKITQSSNQVYTLNNSRCHDLLFSAIYYTEDLKVFTHVSVYSGTIVSTDCDAIISMISLCREHQRSEVQLSDLTSSHTGQKMEYKWLNRIVYNACPFCSVTAILKLLKLIDCDKRNSVAIPLLNTEMDASDVRSLISQIQTFTISKVNRLNHIDFIINNQQRAAEIATWMQKGIYVSNSFDQWNIMKHCRHESWGIKAIYISQDLNQFKTMQSSLEKSIPSCISHSINASDFDTINRHNWQHIVLQFWCQFNTILIRQRQQQKILLYGSEEDVLNAVTAMLEIVKKLIEEKEFGKISKLIARNNRWYVDIFNRKEAFDKKLSYQLEDGYKLYGKDKTHSILSIDGDTKQIDYNNMTITINTGQQYPIEKRCIKDGIYVPNNWDYDRTNTLDDDHYVCIEVKNVTEKCRIAQMAQLDLEDIISLKRIQNWHLWQGFQIRKRRVAKLVNEHAPGTKVEQQLFHGTSDNSAKSISKDGFNRDYCGNNYGTKYGHGTYFAANIQYASHYGSTFIVSRVLTGICNQYDENDPWHLTNVPGSNSDRIHSVIANDGQVFVVFNDNAAYPEYLLSIKPNAWSSSA